jgi:hypothetical protein
MTLHSLMSAIRASLSTPIGIALLILLALLPIPFTMPAMLWVTGRSLSDFLHR